MIINSLKFGAKIGRAAKRSDKLFNFATSQSRLMPRGNRQGVHLAAARAAALARPRPTLESPLMRNAKAWAYALLVSGVTYTCIAAFLLRLGVIPVSASVVYSAQLLIVPEIIAFGARSGSDPVELMTNVFFPLKGLAHYISLLQ
jgi:hypothetical protein